MATKRGACDNCDRPDLGLQRIAGGRFLCSTCRKAIEGIPPGPERERILAEKKADLAEKTRGSGLKKLPPPDKGSSPPPPPLIAAEKSRGPDPDPGSSCPETSREKPADSITCGVDVMKDSINLVVYFNRDEIIKNLESVREIVNRHLDRIKDLLQWPRCVGRFHYSLQLDITGSPDGTDSRRPPGSEAG